MNKKIVCIVGPSGVGKTALSIELAKIFNAEIISADSMQIYRDMNIGTAKINKVEMQGITHHMIDIIDPTDNFSVALWTAQAKTIIDDIYLRNKLPIIVGGTGLYIKSLLFDYDFYDVPENLELRNYYENILETKGIDALYNILVEKDAERAKLIHKNKTKAVIRMLEIIDSKKSIAPKKLSINYEYLLIGLTTDRSTLYEKINNRVDKMIDNGLIIEAKTIMQKYNWGKGCQSALAIGYKELFDYFDGQISYDRMVELIKQHSRNYAKRQFTFFKTMPNILWFNVGEKNKIISQIKEFVQ